MNTNEEIDLGTDMCPYSVYSNGGNTLTPYIKFSTGEIWLASEGNGCGNDEMLLDIEGWTETEIVREYGEFDIEAMRKDADFIESICSPNDDDAKTTDAVEWLRNWCDTVQKVMSRVRYATIDERLDGTRDQYAEYFKSASEAVDAAERDWGYLTDSEKRVRHICAVWSIADEDGEFDWGNYDVIKEFNA